MSQHPPFERPFVPPPPPTQNSLYPPHVLSAKEAEAASEAKNALILSIFGIFCFGFILGYLAVRKANDAMQTIDIYEVAQDKRGLAVAAKVIGIIDIVFWAIALLSRLVLR